MDLWLLVLVMIGIFIAFVYLTSPKWPPLIWLGRMAVMVVIGGFLLFCTNLIGQYAGVYIPFNMATLAVAAFLGIPGIIALVAIRMFIF